MNQAIGQIDEVTQRNAILVEHAAAAAAALQDEALRLSQAVAAFKLDQEPVRPIGQPIRAAIMQLPDRKESRFDAARDQGQFGRKMRA